MNHLSLFGQLSSLPTRQVVQPTVRQPLGPGLAEYLRARGIETRQRYINSLRAGPLDQKQISAAIGGARFRNGGQALRALYGPFRDRGGRVSHRRIAPPTKNVRAATPIILNRLSIRLS